MSLVEEKIKIINYFSQKVNFKLPKIKIHRLYSSQIKIWFIGK